jgi:hypothetical protein
MRARRAKVESEPSLALSASAPIGGFSELLTVMQSSVVDDSNSRQIPGQRTRIPGQRA